MPPVPTPDHHPRIQGGCNQIIRTAYQDSSSSSSSSSSGGISIIMSQVRQTESTLYPRDHVVTTRVKTPMSLPKKQQGEVTDGFT